MAVQELQLPLIDLSGYIDPKSPGDRERVIAEVRDACAKFGFFQTKGHGISLDLQKGLLNSIDTLFNLPKEENRSLSFLQNVSRRGYALRVRRVGHVPSRWR
ncbi:2og-fe oxygenase [Paraphaeosphaeria sporulosa]